MSRRSLACAIAPKLWLRRCGSSLYHERGTAHAHRFAMGLAGPSLTASFAAPPSVVEWRKCVLLRTGEATEGSAVRQLRGSGGSPRWFERSRRQKRSPATLAASTLLW